MSEKRRRDKNDRQKQKAPVSAVGGGGGRLFWVSAFILILSGYIILRKADPAGQNAWSVAAPALLITGYLLVLPAIFDTYRKNS